MMLMTQAPWISETEDQLLALLPLALTGGRALGASVPFFFLLKQLYWYLEVNEEESAHCHHQGLYL